VGDLLEVLDPANRISAFRASSFSRPTRLMPTREGEPVHGWLISLMWRTGGRRPRMQDHSAWLLGDGGVVHGAHVGSRERCPRSSSAIGGHRMWGPDKLTLAIAASVVAVLGDGPAFGRDWYLNTYGLSQQYSISRFNDSGHPVPSTPVIRPSRQGFDKVHIAWPSAIRTPDGIHVYASGFDGQMWKAIGLWTSNDGIVFRRRGPVFAASQNEPHGIGPSHVWYDPAAAEPFGLYFLVRGPSGPGQAIAYATSRDGRVWARRGIVLTADRQEEEAGVSMSYACRSRSGEWVFFYQGYPNLNEGVAMVATADRPEGPFDRKAVLMRGDNVSARVRHGRRRENFVVVDDARLLTPGHIYLLHGKSGDLQNSELVEVAQIKDRVVLLTRPLLRGHDEHAMLSMARAKVDPSFARETSRGWEGIFTVYGPAPGIHAEYTMSVRGRSLQSPWEPTRSGVRFSPRAPEHRYSAENPTPLVRGPSCE
jgi:hypothetical protein